MLSRGDTVLRVTDRRLVKREAARAEPSASKGDDGAGGEVAGHRVRLSRTNEDEGRLGLATRSEQRAEVGVVRDDDSAVAECGAVEDLVVGCVLEPKVANCNGVVASGREQSSHVRGALASTRNLTPGG